jgi:hypothetical protein
VSLIRVTEKGFFCERGGFHIDPWGEVDVALITHGHADHARRGPLLLHRYWSGGSQPVTGRVFSFATPLERPSGSLRSSRCSRTKGYSCTELPMELPGFTMTWAFTCLILYPFPLGRGDGNRCESARTSVRGGRGYWVKRFSALFKRIDSSTSINEKVAALADYFVSENPRNVLRAVRPVHVFEIGFEGISSSNRHKSGGAVRFPRILRWRKDKPIGEADSVESAFKLIYKTNREYP